MLLLFILFCLFCYWMAQVPITIAKKRGICDSELYAIKVLSWCGIIFWGTTWIIAIILSLIWKPKNWINKVSSNDKTLKNNFELLEKLSDLKDKGIITEREFHTEKKKIINNT